MSTEYPFAARHLTALDRDLEEQVARESEPASAGATFNAASGSFVASWGPPQYVTVAVERFAENRDEITAEVTIRSTVPGLGRQLAQRRVPLLGTRAVADLANYLARRRRDPATDWTEILETTFVHAVEARREGEPALSLDAVPERVGSRYAIETLALSDLLTCVWARPGEGKTWVALAVAAALQTGRADILGLAPVRPLRVAVLDWEDDAATKAERVRAIAGAPVPAITYLACRRAIWDESERIQRVIREREIEYLIVDSIGMACGGIPPESSEAALRFGTAARGLAVGMFATAHLPKNTEDTSAPFGSIFWLAQMRLGWYLKREQETTDHGFRLGLYAKKANNDAGARPLGFEVIFADGRTRFARRDRALSEVPELASGLSVRWRLKHALHSGPRVISDVAEEIEEAPDTVARTLRRYAGRDFVRSAGADGVDRWANLARESA